MRLIPLNGKHGVGKFAMVDDEDFEYLNKFKWYANGHGYPVAHVTRNKTRKMHRFLMEKKSGLVIDHIDKNKLNNQRSNLRYCTHAENCRNKYKYKKDGNSKYKGVNYHRQSGRYCAKIILNKTVIPGGYYDTEEEAAENYDLLALKYHGEFASLNFPDKDYSGREAYQPKEQTSEYIGVAIAPNNRWHAQVAVDGRNISLGYYNSEHDAAIARDQYIRDNDLKLTRNLPDEDIDDKVVERRKKKKILKSKGVVQIRNLFYAKVCLGRKVKYIGSFDNELDAAKAYNQYVIDNGLNKTLNILEEDAGAE